MLGILCAALIVGASINRASLDGEISGQFAAPKLAANRLPESGEMRSAPDREKPSLPPATFAADVKSDAARTTLHKGKFSTAADTYRIPSREHFAEILVRRSSGYGGDTAVVLGTQPSSAKPRVRHLPHAPLSPLLPQGKNLSRA